MLRAYRGGESRDIAMLAGDQSNEVWPSGYEGIRSPNHAIAIPHMGLWLIDNANLEDLAVECARNGTDGSS